MTATLENATQKELNDFLRPYVEAHYEAQEIRQARALIAQAEGTGKPTEIPFTSRLSAIVTYDKAAWRWSARLEETGA